MYVYVFHPEAQDLKRRLFQLMSLHLLMYFTQWINVYLEKPNPPFSELTETHSRWIFALLSRVDDLLSADDINLLRNLARAALALLKQLIQTRARSTDEEGPSHSGAEEGAGGAKILMSERSCWMVVCAVAGVWEQRDLWADAETMLTGLES
jgi:hypothetical protein